MHAERTIVYRIQDADGRGPWKPGYSHRWVEDRPDHDNLLPSFMEFGPVYQQILYGEHAGSGCLTVEQLRRWITQSEYAKLKALGYKAVKMRVGRIIASSDVQCVFGCPMPLNQECEEFELY